MNTTDFFSRTHDLLGNEAFSRLQSLRVILFGVGGVGSWCAEALVRSGLIHLTLVDFDVVAPSNINRQAPACSHTIGRAKVDVMRERLIAINPAAQITVLNQRYEESTAATFSLESFDCVVDAIDSVSAKAHLIRRSLALPSLHLFSSMGAALRLDPTRIRTAPFTQVGGDGLARALRQHFKKTGGLPTRPFTCVYSTEPPRPTQNATRPSYMPVTATFGLTLAAQIMRVGIP